MAAFKYEGFDRNRKKVSGSIEATNIKEAKRLLRREGIQARKVTKPTIFEVDLGAVIAEKTGAASFGEKDLARFTGQLSTLVDSGVPILQALEILYKQEKNSGLKKSLIRIAQAVGEGQTLNEAMSKEKGFDRLYCQLIKAGEIAGILDTILNKIETFLEKRIALKAQIKNAFRYPTIIVVVGVGVVAGLVTFVVPQFVDMIEGSGQEIPYPTQLVMDISEFFQNHFILLFFGSIGIVIGLTMYIRTPIGKSVFDRAIMKAPLFGPIVIKGNLGSFSQTLSTMLSSGISIVEALEICADTIDNTVIQRDIRRVRQAVMKGKSMTEPLKKISYFPPLIAQMIEVGESTGNLDQMLLKVSKVFEIEVEGSVSNMTQMIEPIILVGLGGVIAFILIAMYLPVFESAGGAV